MHFWIKNLLPPDIFALMVSPQLPNAYYIITLVPVCLLGMQVMHYSAVLVCIWVKMSMELVLWLLFLWPWLGLQALTDFWTNNSFLGDCQMCVFFPQLFKNWFWYFTCNFTCVMYDPIYEPLAKDGWSVVSFKIINIHKYDLFMLIIKNIS